jgi:hypothetical protein
MSGNYLAAFIGVSLFRFISSITQLAYGAIVFMWNNSLCAASSKHSNILLQICDNLNEWWLACYVFFDYHFLRHPMVHFVLSFGLTFSSTYL